MARRRLFLLFGLALAVLQPGCLLPGEKGSTAQKPREPATLPPGESAELCLAVADQMIASGHYPEAIHQLNHVRHLNPRADISPRLARLYARLGKDEHALVEFEKALKLHPKDAALWNDLGYHHYERGNWREAETALRKALAIEPDNKKAWMNLGLTLGQDGKYQEALVAFEEAVKPAEARCNLAFVLGTQGKLDEARRLYREALEMDPNLKLARVALAKLDRTVLTPTAPPSVIQVSAPPPPDAVPTPAIQPPTSTQPLSKPGQPTLAYPDP